MWGWIREIFKIWGSNISSHSTNCVFQFLVAKRIIAKPIILWPDCFMYLLNVGKLWHSLSSLSLKFLGKRSNRDIYRCIFRKVISIPHTHIHIPPWRAPIKYFDNSCYLFWTSSCCKICQSAPLSIKLKATNSMKHITCKYLELPC